MTQTDERRDLTAAPFKIEFPGETFAKTRCASRRAILLPRETQQRRQEPGDRLANQPQAQPAGPPVLDGIGSENATRCPPPVPLLQPPPAALKLPAKLSIFEARTVGQGHAPAGSSRRITAVRLAEAGRRLGAWAPREVSTSHEDSSLQASERQRPDSVSCPAFGSVTPGYPPALRPRAAHSRTPPHERSCGPAPSGPRSGAGARPSPSACRPPPAPSR